MKNNDYCLGDALMEERKSEAKWVVKCKLEEIDRIVCKNGCPREGDIIVLTADECSKIGDLLNQTLNIVENEL